MTIQSYSAVYFVMNHGKGEDVAAALHHEGVSGASVLPATGAMQETWLCFLGLDVVRKEIVFFIDETKKSIAIMDRIASQFHLDKKHHGIAFAVPVVGVYGLRGIENSANEERKAEQIMWQIIYTVVNKGEAKGVVDAASKAGARGGTICKGRGSAAHTGKLLFDFPVEPEKEVVFVLAQKEKTKDIVNEIHKALRIDEPGRGIIFVMNVEEAYGLVE